MGTVYAFFADGFEEIEAFTAVDTLRRAGLNVQIVSVTPDEIVMGAHDVSLLCDINFENCDFFDADLLLLPGGMPGAATLDKHEGLCCQRKTDCSDLRGSDGIGQIRFAERPESNLLPQLRTIPGRCGMCQ